MLRKLKFYREEKGDALILFAFLFIIFIGISGLVVDAGILYKTKSELRKTATAAVLSGAQELINSDSAVTTVVQNILNEHNETNSLKEIIIKPNGENKIKVTLEKNVPSYFMKLFNMKSFTIDAYAAAKLAPMISSSRSVPLGIDKNIQLEYMNEYRLKVDARDSTYGNFGVLALSGVGADLFEQDLMYGFNTELEQGDIVSTQTGNVEGKTRNGVNYRINSSLYTEYDPSQRDDPRVIKILVYEPYEIAHNQVMSVKIWGYAYFYLKEPMSPNDSEIVGFFIEKVGAGIGDENAKDYGAYAVKLIE